jgi:hypothetical protein
LIINKARQMALKKKGFSAIREAKMIRQVLNLVVHTTSTGVHSMRRIDPYSTYSIRSCLVLEFWWGLVGIIPIKPQIPTHMFDTRVLGEFNPRQSPLFPKF